MREISEKFVADLTTENGVLSPIYRIIKDEKYNLLWEIRDKYISIYYKGGRLFEIKEKNYGYRIDWDINYTSKNNTKIIDEELYTEITANSPIKEKKDCDFWIEKLDVLINWMEQKWASSPKKEKFIQHAYSIMPDLKKDLIITDFEYQKEGLGEDLNKKKAARFDLMGVRKDKDENILSFIELKQSYESCSSSGNASGLFKHYKDIVDVVSSKQILKDEVLQAIQLYKTKSEIDQKIKTLPVISDKRLEVLFVLANYVSGKNFSTVLEKEIEKISNYKPQGIEINVVFQFLKVDYPTKNIAEIKEYSKIISINDCLKQGKEFYKS